MISGIVRAFVRLLGICINTIFTIAFAPISWVLRLLGLTTGKSPGDKIAEKIYQATEDSVQGKKRNPLKTLLLWLLMFAIFAAALVIAGVGLS